MAAVLSLHEGKSQSNWKSRVEAILDLETPFIYSAEFDDSTQMEADEECVCALLENRRPVRSRRGSKTSRSTLSTSLFAALPSLALPLLDVDEERALFRRLNFLRYRVNVLRSRIHRSRPARKAVAVVEDMLADVDRIRTRITESNTRLVVSISSKLASETHELEDFVCEGLMILLNAVDKFDYSRGYRFSTYATHAVQRHLFRLRHRNYRHAARFVPVETGALIDMRGGAVDETPPTDQEQLCRAVLESASQILSAREQYVIRLRFGLDGETRHTLREVADLLGVSKERVRQIQIRALQRVRESATAFGLPLDAIEIP